MGNKLARKMGQQPYNQMVEEAISALKERPGSTQSDILQYLEAKYEKKISQKNKNLETVIRSVIKSKTRGGGRPPMRGFDRTTRRVGSKAERGPRRKFGQGLPRGRSLGLKLKAKTIPKPHMVTLKQGKKSLVMSGGHQRQQLRERPKRRPAMRGSKFLLRPARRTNSVGSMDSMSLLLRRGRSS